MEIWVDRVWRTKFPTSLLSLHSTKQVFRVYRPIIVLRLILYQDTWKVILRIESYRYSSGLYFIVFENELQVFNDFPLVTRYQTFVSQGAHMYTYYSWTMSIVSESEKELKFHLLVVREDSR